MDITSYILGKKAGGGTPVSLQDKEITIATNGETEITPDSGYDGLRKVDLTTNVPQPSGKITITQNGTDIDVSSYASADVSVSGGENFIYPEYTKIYDSSCIGGPTATTLTTSVNALKDNIVYAVVCARDTITVPSGWTFLKSEKSSQGGSIQTQYIYYKISNSDGEISFTVNQASNVRLFLSLFAMKYSYDTPLNIVSEEVTIIANQANQPINNINLVEGNFLALSITNSSSTSLSTFTLNCKATKYATSNDEQRLTVFRIDEDVKDIVITLDNDQPVAGTFSYIKFTPQLGTNNINILLEAFEDNYVNYAFNTNYGLYGSSSTSWQAWKQIIKNITFEPILSTTTTSCQGLFNDYPGEELHLGKFDTSNITTMNRMFYSCDGLKSLDLSNFDITNVTNMSSMFFGCTSLTHIDIRNMVFSTKTGTFNISDMLRNVPATCEIIVKDANEKAWFNTNFSSYTNVKTVAEYEAE